jgi:hypothetical protein
LISKNEEATRLKSKSLWLTHKCGKLFVYTNIVKGSMKKILLSLAAFAAATALSAQPAMAKELNMSDYEAEFGQAADPARLLNVEGTVTLHDISPEEVFAFVSNLENDPQLYPGTFNAVRTSGDGGVGTTYTETIYFGGAISDITATILGYKENHWLKFKADNLLNNVSAYEVKASGSDDTELELESFVYVPEGVTQADMELFMTLVFQNMMTAFNTTGEIEIL